MRVNVLKTYSVGQRLMMDILKPEMGNFPISRTDEGVICKFEQQQTKKYFEYGSRWEFEVVEVREKCLIVKPLSLYFTKAQNEQTASALALRFFGKTKIQKQKKEKFNYQFKASYEK